MECAENAVIVDKATPPQRKSISVCIQTAVFGSGTSTNVFNELTFNGGQADWYPAYHSDIHHMTKSIGLSCQYVIVAHFYINKIDGHFYPTRACAKRG